MFHLQHLRVEKHVTHVRPSGLCTVLRPLEWIGCCGQHSKACATSFHVARSVTFFTCRTFTPRTVPHTKETVFPDYPCTSLSSRRTSSMYVTFRKASTVSFFGDKAKTFKSWKAMKGTPLSHVSQTTYTVDDMLCTSRTPHVRFIICP